MTPDSPASAPLISVVITCFNYGRYVAQAIDSALEQAYQNKEIIVVNDGSTDDSSQVLRRYAGRVRIIEQENRGSIGAYNRGFAASRGALIILLDADDLLAPEALAAIAAAWYPACTKVQYDLSIVDGAGRDLGRRFCNFDGGYDVTRVRRSFRRTGTYRWPVTVGNAYSRWFAERLFPLQVKHGPDGVLNTVAPVYGDVVTIPRVLASYRLHGTNMWSSDGQDHSRLPVRIRDRCHEVALMREHARGMNVEVPAVNVLDHELPFLNYRLMAVKLGLDYPGKDADSLARLLVRALRQVARESLPLRSTVAHAAWFVVFSATPARLSPHLIRLRFNRSAVIEALRQLFPWQRGSDAAARAAPSPENTVS